MASPASVKCVLKNCNGKPSKSQELKPLRSPGLPTCASVQNCTEKKKEENKIEAGGGGVSGTKLERETRCPVSETAHAGRLERQVTSFGIVSTLHLFDCADCPPTFTQSSGPFCAGCLGSPGAARQWRLPVSPSSPFNASPAAGIVISHSASERRQQPCVNVREVTCF